MVLKSIIERMNKEVGLPKDIRIVSKTTVMVWIYHSVILGDIDVRHNPLNGMTQIELVDKTFIYSQSDDVNTVNALFCFMDGYRCAENRMRKVMEYAGYAGVIK